MAREQQYQGFILKKQQLFEADELVTFYTQEIGKIRGIAKSSKRSQSKLQYQLQPMFLTSIVLSGKGNLLQIIRAQALQTFSSIHSSQLKTKFWYIIAELILKATPDEQPNELLFEGISEYLDFLEKADEQEEILQLGLTKFKINFCEAVGFGILAPPVVQGDVVFFSNSRGGFCISEKPFDGLSITGDAYSMFQKLKTTDFSSLINFEAKGSDLNSLLSDFISFQLEREIKAEKFIQ